MCLTASQTRQVTVDCAMEQYCQSQVKFRRPDKPICLKCISVDEKPTVGTLMNNLVKTVGKLKYLQFISMDFPRIQTSIHQDVKRSSKMLKKLLIRREFLLSRMYRYPIQFQLFEENYSANYKQLDA